MGQGALCVYHGERWTTMPVWFLQQTATPHAVMKPGPRIVFITLKSFMPNPAPGIRRLAADVGVSPTTLIKHLDDLEMSGWILREYRDASHGETNKYHLFEHPIPLHERRWDIQERIRAEEARVVREGGPESGIQFLESRNCNKIEITPNRDKDNNMTSRPTGTNVPGQAPLPAAEKIGLFDVADADEARVTVPSTRTDYARAIIGTAKTLPWAGYLVEQGLDLGMFFGKLVKDGWGVRYPVPDLPALHRLLESLQAAEAFPRPGARCYDAWGWLLERCRIIMQADCDATPPFDFRWTEWAERLGTEDTWEGVQKRHDAVTG